MEDRLRQLNININADAALILNSAAKAVKAILERRNQLDREGKQGVPLIVLAGEAHLMPAHYVHHVAVLNGLRDKAAIAVGIELDHSTLAQGFSVVTGHEPAPAVATVLQESDRAGVMSLKTSLGLSGSIQASHAQSALFRFLLRRNIPARFTDAAKLGNALDPGDPSTAESLRVCFGCAADNIESKSPEGVYARNHHMAAMALALASDSGARIVFQLCGNAHVIGCVQDGDLARNSLAQQFKARNAAVLAMPLLSNGYYTEADIPADHGLAENERLFITGPPETTAIYDHFTDEPVADEFATLQCRADEAAYVNALLERVGAADERLSVEEYWPWRREQYVDMRGVFLECDKLSL